MRVRAPALDDGVELRGLRYQRFVGVLQGREEAGVHLGHGGNVHGGGEGVVGGLALVDVVVGMDGFLTWFIAGYILFA